MNRTHILSLAFLFSSLFSLAQGTQNFHSADHDHGHGHHHEHEIGFSVSPVYFFSEKEFSGALHLHYVYNFPHTQWGIGLGYERIFDEHKHNFIGPEVNFRPIHKLTLNLSPGLAFEGEHRDQKDFALHFETVYEFELGALHLGPSFELAYHTKGFHTSLGLHLGLGL